MYLFMIKGWYSGQYYPKKYIHKINDNDNNVKQLYYEGYTYKKNTNYK